MAHHFIRSCCCARSTNDPRQIPLKECPHNHNRSRPLLQWKITFKHLQHKWRLSQEGSCDFTEAQRGRLIVFQPRDSGLILWQWWSQMQIPGLCWFVCSAECHQGPTENARLVREGSLRGALYQLSGHGSGAQRQPGTGRVVRVGLHVKPHNRDVPVQRPRPQDLLEGHKGVLLPALPESLFQQPAVHPLQN